MSIFSDIAEVLKAHLANQPYKMQDFDGNELDCFTEVDENGDVTATIDLTDKNNKIKDLEAKVESLEVEVEGHQETIRELEDDIEDLKSAVNYYRNYYSN